MMTGMLENLANSFGWGMLFVSEDKSISGCSKKTKEMFGMILPLGVGYGEGEINEGDIVIIADNEIGNDDKLTPEDLTYLNIHDDRISMGDAVLAIGVYINKKIQPVYKFFPALSIERKISLSRNYMGFRITTSIDYDENRMTIDVNGTSYYIDFIESAGHMVVIDGTSGAIKFFQSNGYGFREEEIGHLLRGKRFMAKGSDEKFSQIIGMNVETIFEGEEFIDAVHHILSCEDGTYVSKVFQIHKRVMYCHMIRMKKGSAEDGLCILIKDKDSIKSELSYIDEMTIEVEKRKKKKELLQGTQCQDGLKRFIGNDPKMSIVKQLAYKASNTKFNVILTGESGTGKSRLAREIHHLGNDNAPFVEVTCNAIAPSLFESELFGYAPGAFTGAMQGGRAGFFEEADGGTIFLDEIGELPPEIQVKLLHVLQNKKIYRVGSTKPIDVDVRVITATNKNLEEEVKKGNFRKDLYYRINVFPVHIPPLRERKRDIYLLANSILENLCTKYGMEKKQFSEEALEVMFSYDWPGNVRELENLIERAITLCDGKLIYQEHLPIGQENQVVGDLKMRLAQEELRIIEEVLYRNNNDKLITAKELGISKSALYEKLRKNSYSENLE